MIRHIAILFAVFWSGSARADDPIRAAKVGDVYEITMVRKSEEQRGDQGSGSSFDRDTIIERVVAVRTDGLELEYDLPESAEPAERRSNWQLPAVVFKPNVGPLRLLNGPALEARVDAWLKAGRMTRENCGRWIFTWNAFRIECDPQSILGWVNRFDLRPAGLLEGAPYRDDRALEPMPWTRRDAAGGPVFALELKVDPETVRKSRAEADVVTGEIMREPTTFEAAMRKRQREAISGTISITIAADPQGNVRRRTTVVKTMIKAPDERAETETTTETVQRRRIAGPTG
jgi:hypothetical protein